MSHVHTRQSAQAETTTDRSSKYFLLWRNWWRKQSPHRQDRFAILAPLLAVVLFSLAIISTLAYFRSEENARELEIVQRDVEYMQQRIRLQMAQSQTAVTELAKTIGLSQINAAAFSPQAEQLLNKNSELVSLLIVDATGKVQASYSTASVFKPPNHLPGHSFRRSESAATSQNARPSEMPIWTRPTLAPEGTIEYHAPYFNKKGQFIGVVVAQYGLDALLVNTIPSDLKKKYALSIANFKEQLVAGTIIEKNKPVQSFFAWFDKPKRQATPAVPLGHDLILHAQSYRTSIGLLGGGLIWLVALLSALTIWLLMGTWRHTRKRLQAQQALLKETNFRRAMENSMLTGMRVLDMTGRITYVNPAFCQMTGWAEQELINQLPPYSYWPDDEHERLHKVIQNELAGRIESGGSHMRIKRKNGELFDARMYLAPLIEPSGVQSGWITSVTDITEPNRIRDQLSATQERFTTVLEGLGAAVSVVPLGSSELLFANGQYKQWFGTTSSSHMLLVAQAGTYPMTSHEATDAIDSFVGLPTSELVQAMVEHVEIFSPKLDKWLEIRSRYLNWVDGRLVQMMIASDITARRLAEEQAIRQTEKAQAASRLITMGEMASSVAHELTQPLTAINNYCTGLLTRIQNDTIDQASLLTALEKTTHQAQRAGQIIQRIRSFVQRSEPNRTSADIAQMVQEAIELAQIEFKRQRVRLTQYIEANLPPLEVDPILIEQVLVNLLKNAAEAIDMAGRPAAQRKVELRVVSNVVDGQSVVEFSVTDTGKGIAPEMLKHLYEAFFSTKREGMGIGLNLCRSIIESHKGRIEAQNLYNDEMLAGCRFVFWLPIDAV